MKEQITVRFAPSPTGSLHIGSARTALFNFLYARKLGGRFLLRVEDTDRQRSTRESLDTILDGLAWLGLAPDEKPVFQSERIDAHRKAAERLVENDQAYWQEDPERGRALLFRIPREAPIVFQDLILGEIKVDPAEDPALQKDLVILKSDGSPTYNFAVVVDDAEMDITHVIRGQDHINNTPKQILLYRALNYDIPTFAHIPLILDPRGVKISKRKTYDFPVTVGEVRSTGYLPDAFMNFLALLGWSPGDDREAFKPDELIEAFDLARVSRSAARFLPEKLDHINGTLIRSFSPEELLGLVRPYLEDEFDLSDWTEERLLEVVASQRERIARLSDITGKTAFLFQEKISIDPKAEEKVLKKNDGFGVLRLLREKISPVEPFTPENVEAALREISAEHEIKFKNVAQPLRVALTGSTASPPIQETVVMLGKERVVERLEQALALAPTP